MGIFLDRIALYASIGVPILAVTMMCALRLGAGPEKVGALTRMAGILFALAFLATWVVQILALSFCAAARTPQRGLAVAALVLSVVGPSLFILSGMTAASAEAGRSSRALPILLSFMAGGAGLLGNLFHIGFLGRLARDARAFGAVDAAASYFRTLLIAVAVVGGCYILAWLMPPFGLLLLVLPLFILGVAIVLLVNQFRMLRILGAVFQAPRSS
jgi:hypothetical protein